MTADLEDFDIGPDLASEFSPKQEDTNMPSINYDANKYLNTTATPARMSPFDELVNAVDALREAQGFASQIADKIAGSVPRAVSGDKADQRGPSGLVDVVEIAVENIRGLAASLTEDMQRIERRL